MVFGIILVCSLGYGLSSIGIIKGGDEEVCPICAEIMIKDGKDSITLDITHCQTTYKGCKHRFHYKCLHNHIITRKSHYIDFNINDRNYIAERADSSNYAEVVAQSNIAMRGQNDISQDSKRMKIEQMRMGNEDKKSKDLKDISDETIRSLHNKWFNKVNGGLERKIHFLENTSCPICKQNIFSNDLKKIASKLQIIYTTPREYFSSNDVNGYVFTEMKLAVTNFTEMSKIYIINFLHNNRYPFMTAIPYFEDYSLLSLACLYATETETIKWLLITMIIYYVLDEMNIPDDIIDDVYDKINALLIKNKSTDIMIKYKKILLDHNLPETENSDVFDRDINNKTGKEDLNLIQFIFFNTNFKEAPQINEIFMILTEFGVDISVFTTNNSNILQLAAHTIITYEIIDYCIQNKVDITHKNDSGETFFGIIYKYNESSNLQKRIRYDAANIYAYIDSKYFAMSLGFS